MRGMLETIIFLGVIWGIGMLIMDNMTDVLLYILVCLTWEMTCGMREIKRNMQKRL
jgi:hypothetical protein